MYIRKNNNIVRDFGLPLVSENYSKKKSDISNKNIMLVIAFVIAIITFIYMYRMYSSRNVTEVMKRKK